ncbi:unnamed protein product [Cylicocyclus nassatus]|uniref:aECM cysteine-cradle domain-containing protein n=1 Tax=Cylicocyclus nassatus TaxID=53992 RepID=A0AA36HEH2_CYLNA|nr:unnamed protein product [Cylicocyclus nassatus]
MIDHCVVFLIGLGYLVEGKDLGMNSIPLKNPFFPERLTRNSDGFLPSSQAEAAPSVFLQESEVETHENSFQQAKVPSASKDDLRVVPSAPKKKKKKRKGKKKKMRKVKVKPRGGRHIKDTYQDLRSLSMQNTDEEANFQATTQNVVIFEPIYDKSTGSSYTQEELLKLCHETENVSAKFGITDMSSFAGSNCALIQLYYPEVTCEQINVFLEYCQNATPHA